MIFQDARRGCSEICCKGATIVPGTVMALSWPAVWVRWEGRASYLPWRLRVLRGLRRGLQPYQACCLGFRPPLNNGGPVGICMTALEVLVSRASLIRTRGVTIAVAQRNAYNHVHVTRELYKIYCEMAEAAVEVCVACAQPVLVATKRRRFKSASSSHNIE